MAVNRKDRFWLALEREEEGGRLVRAVHFFLFVLIVANIVAVVLDSVPAFHDRYSQAFLVFENISVSVFAVEYLLRFWSCTADPRYRHPLRGRIRFALTPVALVDLIAILPTILFFLPMDLRVLRGLRIMRLIRIGKLGRYSEAASLLLRVIKARWEELLVSLSILSIFAVICATLMYMIEGTVQPDKFPHIPAAMWWAFVTITTVGYGDVFPVTPLGRILGVLTTLIGILMVALPAGIFVTAFLDELNKGKESLAKKPLCPHCGKAPDEHSPHGDAI